MVLAKLSVEERGLCIEGGADTYGVCTLGDGAVGTLGDSTGEGDGVIRIGLTLGGDATVGRGLGCCVSGSMRVGCTAGGANVGEDCSVRDGIGSARVRS